MLNRWVLSWDRKTAAESEEVTRSGRLFQMRAAVTGKARSPTVDSRVRLTISDKDEVELVCCLTLCGLSGEPIVMWGRGLSRLIHKKPTLVSLEGIDTRCIHHRVLIQSISTPYRSV